MTGDVVLIVWFLADVAWGAFLFGGCAYLVFWRGNSGWWFVLALILGPALGGEKLYKRLSERTEAKGEKV